jgi:hypothetical protein
MPASILSKPAWIVSKIDRDIAFGLAAAHQHVAISRRLDGVGPIADGAGDESGLQLWQTWIHQTASKRSLMA